MSRALAERRAKDRAMKLAKRERINAASYEELLEMLDAPGNSPENRKHIEQRIEAKQKIQAFADSKKTSADWQQLLDHMETIARSVAKQAVKDSVVKVIATASIAGATAGLLANAGSDYVLPLLFGPPPG